MVRAYLPSTKLVISRHVGDLVDQGAEARGIFSLDAAAAVGQHRQHLLGLDLDELFEPGSPWALAAGGEGQPG